ncbi:hypothetical protein [Clostridium isatidis]|uniref:Uncharacterized protein n=1 Tax=Clostridium isatidis TaxID=182773 RepID=A0A343JBF7_9CLOT|nr:hypothetical protein [Clostridium isatidis]ASW42865.1 hypothetical protein BEN51_05085 [Clostridium isatidis]
MEENNVSKDEKIIYLISKGIIKLYESNKQNFVELPRELKRAINILAANKNIFIEDRNCMVDLFSKNICE